MCAARRARGARGLGPGVRVLRSLARVALRDRCADGPRIFAGRPGIEGIAAHHGGIGGRRDQLFEGSRHHARRQGGERGDPARVRAQRDGGAGRAHHQRLETLGGRGPRGERPHREPALRQRVRGRRRHGRRARQARPRRGRGLHARHGGGARGDVERGEGGGGRGAAARRPARPARRSCAVGGSGRQKRGRSRDGPRPPGRRGRLRGTGTPPGLRRLDRRGRAPRGMATSRPDARPG